jgi:transcriptional regulator GlxA family with amidase domain
MIYRVDILLFDKFETLDVFGPGGSGTREKVNDVNFTAFIRNMASESKYILSVCTGSALLARAGILNGKRATSNKRAFKWVVEQGQDVHWVKEARWVNDDKIYTSSGVSAGIDMALGFIGDLFGKEKALEISNGIEYMWNENSEYDPFIYINYF